MSNVVMVKAGISYSLALKADGTVWAWGDNSLGELGDGTITTRITPVAVVCGAAAGDTQHCSLDGHLKGVTQIAAGDGNSLAVLDNGAVLAWGFNSKFNSSATSFTPVYVVCGAAAGADCAGGLLTNATQVSAGFSHSMVLLNDGTVLAWGTNNNGNLGNNIPGTSSSIPVQVSGLGIGSGVTAISAGQNFSLALKSNGMVVAWGSNSGGKLGDGTNTNRAAPVGVLCGVEANDTQHCTADGHLKGVSQVAAGQSGYAVVNDGTLLAWGTNSTGQLGDGTTTNRSTPVYVCAVGTLSSCSLATGNTLQNVVTTFGSSLSNSGYAVQSDGTLLAWGINANGQLGDGSRTQRNVPVQISGLGGSSGVIAVGAGDLHALAIKGDGTLYSWGNNSSGQLGNGTIFAQVEPVQTFGLGSGSGVIAISARAQFTLALKSDGTVLAWGNNGNGQLGDGTFDNKNSPVQVTCRTGDTSGTTFCTNAHYLRGVAAIAAGSNNYALALMNDGTVLSWGNNANGQLGDGTTNQRNTPGNVCAASPCPLASGNFLQGITAIAAGLSSLALVSDGTALAWGNNANGFVGDGTMTQRNTPVHVCAVGAAFPCSAANGNILHNVSAIAAGGSNAIFLQTDGTVLASGENLAKQLGDGTVTSRSTPVYVCDVGAFAPCSVPNGNVLQGVFAIAGNGGFALMNVGATTTAVGWGVNNAGQLGDGTTTNQSTPVYICATGATAPCSTFGNNILGVSAASSTTSTYTLMSDQSVLAFGANSSGQLGDGEFTNRNIPNPVSGLLSGSGVVAVSAGSGFAVALKSDGTVLAWGANDVGELGDGTVYTANLLPSPVLFDDTTPPTIVFGKPVPLFPNGANGWYVTDVSIPWTGADADSELDSTENPLSPLVLTGEGTAVSGKVTLCDVASNCAMFDSPSFMIDKTAPQVTVSVSPDVLWPPNKQRVDVTITINVSDNLSLAPQPIVNFRATSNEADVAGDVNGHDGFTNPVPLTPGPFVFDTGSSTSGSSSTSILLRADRSGSGTGRVYSIAGTVQDAAGNQRPFSTVVTVPHNQLSDEQ
jgi:alpha-tubulin suppressor-like RCC1 family protein